MDFMDEFSVDVKKAVVQLRKKLENEEEYNSEILQDDVILCNFLKGCNFKFNQAEQMLKKHIRWRKIHQIDRILQDYRPIEVPETYISQSFLGFDKEGHPIRYNAAGNTDIEGILKSATFHDMLRCIVHLLESDIMKTKEQSKKLKKNISQFVYIYNLEHLTLAKALNKRTLDHCKIAASIYQDNYPERLKSVYVINAPPFFTILYTIIKSVISTGLLKKVKVFGYCGWKESLSEVIDENVLPAFLGGKRTDPDGNPLCKSFVNHGYPVPEKYYIFNNPTNFRNRKDVRKITIKRQRRLEMNVFIEKGGSVIEWEFEVMSRNIGFGLSFEDDEKHRARAKELIPVHKTETPDSPESGMYYCENTGKYILIFDNSYSIWTSKDIFLSVFVNREK